MDKPSLIVRLLYFLYAVFLITPIGLASYGVFLTSGNMTAWVILLVAGIVLLLVEWFIFKRFTKLEQSYPDYKPFWEHIGL